MYKAVSRFFSSGRRIVCLAVLFAVSANAVAVVTLEPEDIELGESEPFRIMIPGAGESLYLFQSVSVAGRTAADPIPQWSVSSSPRYGEVGFILSGVERDTTATAFLTASGDTVIIRYHLVEDPFPEINQDKFEIVVAAGDERTTVIFTVGIQNTQPQILELEFDDIGRRTVQVLAPKPPDNPAFILEIAGGDTEARYTFYAGKARNRSEGEVGITPYFSWSVFAIDSGASVAFANGRQTTTGRGINTASTRLVIIFPPSGGASPIEIVYREDDPISFDAGPEFVVVVEDTVGRATTLNVSVEQASPVIIYRDSPVGSELSIVSHEQSPVDSFMLSADYLCPTFQCLVWGPESLIESPRFSAGGDPVTVISPGAGLVGETFEITVVDENNPGKSATVDVEIRAQQNTRPEILSIDGREPPFGFVVASNLGIAKFSAVAEDDFDTEDLTWRFDAVQFSTGENNALGFLVDGRLEDEATGNNVMLELRRDDGETTVTFELVVRDSLGAEGSSGEVKVTVGDTVPTINSGALPPITAGESGTFTLSAEDEGLGQKEELKWEVVAGSFDNLVVEDPSDNTGAEVEVTATLVDDVRIRLDGSFILQVQNSVGSINTRRVTVSRSNEPPVVSYQSQNLTFQGTGDTTPVRIVLPSGTDTTQIELSADDPVGEPEGDFSWTITGNPPDSGSDFVTRAVGSSVIVQFQVPEDLAGEGRRFTIQVSDGRGENAVSNIPVVVSRTTGQLFRIRMFLGGAAR